MARTVRRFLLVLVLAFAALPATASADIGPPWCGTPEPGDAAEALPDGTEAGDPEGSFPHIPHYAVGCTLRDIERRSNGRMDVDVIGESVNGRKMYSVVINELRTSRQRRDYLGWLGIRALMLESPNAALKLARALDDDVKVPVLVQGSIHGNEYEGLDSAMEVIEKYALTPRGQDPAVDNVLDHAILIFNPIQNPDGRFNGVRQNANGFDLNRDYMTQSQPETIVSRNLMQRWLAPEMLDLHGYVEPMLIEATTKPHNPSIEYDLWLKWNQSRIDANEAAVNAIGRDIQRPINDWCADTSMPAPGELCPDGRPPGPAVAEGWDDWGPFYTAMYAQHVGLDSSTVEMCEVDLEADPQCGGRLGARDVQLAVVESTLEFMVEEGEEMFADELEVYRRGDEDAPRPACCPAPFDVDNNWMHDYPQAYVIPVGEGQRSDAEANRLVEWLLFNDIEVTELKEDYTVGGQRYEAGSYVVWIAQPRRGLLDTALSLGMDISARISILYAPPAAWSHGYLWGADVVTIEDGAPFSPETERINRPNRINGGLVGSGRRAAGWTLELDSPAAVRALNALVDRGVDAGLALEAFSGGAAGTVVFGTGAAAERALEEVGERFGVRFRQLKAGALPNLQPIDHVPRFRVLYNPGNRAGLSDAWSLRNLGFVADPVTVAQLNTEATDPLAGYDLLYNAVISYPSASNAVARNRLAAFFAAGGGYISGQATGANFLVTGGQAPGLSVVSDSGGGSGWSGILLWDNTGGANSVITGAYPSRDTLIADPPTWLTSVPGTMTVDARLATGDFFASGLFPPADASSAAGSTAIAHGTNTANTARLVVFASNPLYRADPEREWPMVGTAAYWADGD
jgi:Zinc carboxypeptidase